MAEKPTFLAFSRWAHRFGYASSAGPKYLCAVKLCWIQLGRMTSTIVTHSTDPDPMFGGSERRYKLNGTLRRIERLRLGRDDRGKRLSMSASFDDPGEPLRTFVCTPCAQYQ
jgi:hypothetical protein